MRYTPRKSRAKVGRVVHDMLIATDDEWEQAVMDAVDQIMHTAAPHDTERPTMFGLAGRMVRGEKMDEDLEGRTYRAGMVLNSMAATLVFNSLAANDGTVDDLHARVERFARAVLPAIRTQVELMDIDPNPKPEAA